MQILIAAGLGVVILIIIVASRVGDRYGLIRPGKNVTEAYESTGVPFHETV
jgi:hypothetical protein